MIGLVLDYTRWKILQLELEALAVPIERRHRNVLRARHAAADVGNAQAALPALNRLVALDGDLGIDEHDRVTLAVAVSIEHRDEYPEAFVHLRRRQADARVLEHRVNH